MNRTLKLLPFILYASVVPANAGVVVTHSQSPTPGLPGFQTFIVTATSTIPGEPIHVVDFIGDPDNNDPNTARGFVGPMNQVQIGGFATEFEDFFDLGTTVIPNADELRAMDSHFLYNSSTEVVVPAGFRKESNSLLRGLFAGTAPIGQTIEFAQIVVPNGSSVGYRGSFSHAQGGTIVDTPDVIGMLVAVPEPATLALCLGFGVFGSLLNRHRLRRC